MLWDDPTPEEEEEILNKLSEVIYDYDMDLVAILFLESIKPISPIGAQLGRYLVAPFIPFLGHKAIPYLATFENRQNLEKLIKKLEDRIEKEEEEIKKMKKEGGKKTGWKRFLPF
jgi:hypothetical protein